MPVRRWFRPPHQVLTIFLVLAVVSAATLVGLALHILRQDRDLQRDRQRDQLEQAADRATVAMQRALADLQPYAGAFDSAGTAQPADVIAVSITNDVVRIRPDGILRYYPVVAAVPDLPPATFAEGTRLEFAARDLPRAFESYARLAASSDAMVRAEALLRTARVARALGDTASALRAYDDLAKLGSTPVQSLPSGLAARLGRITVFRKANRTTDVSREAAALLADLQHGSWQITRAVYDAYVAEARSLTGAAVTSDDGDAVARAEAVEWLWENRGAVDAAGRRLLRSSTGFALVIWSTRRDELTAVVAGRRHLTAIASRVLPTTLAWSLSDAEGQTLIGDASPLPSAAVRPAAAAGLPWTLHVFNAPGPQPPTPQRPFLLLVLVLVTLVLGAGWFFIFRSLARERQIAELQSDFVAAVSHEFRSPLTSIGHISELLAHGRLEADGPRREAYGVLVRDTARLRGLVEGLLDFGRFDAGPSAFRFEEIDVGELVETTVADFRDRAAAEGFRIDVVGSLESVVARADREAMTRALWNLLDNAVKYSPDSRTIRVELAATGDRVAVGVRDRGIGIPSEEQQRIFDRFVRGTAAKSRRIRGTGIGLAMVRQIVAAHGGEIAVASEPGQGSCFTIQLPVVSRGSETWRACSSSKTNPALPSA